LEFFRKTKCYAHLRIVQGLIWYDINMIIQFRLRLSCVHNRLSKNRRISGLFCGLSFFFITNYNCNLNDLLLCQLRRSEVYSISLTHIYLQRRTCIYNSTYTYWHYIYNGLYVDKHLFYPIDSTLSRLQTKKRFNLLF